MLNNPRLFPVPQTKTNYDDKASDYEDIWSPQYSGKSQTPRLSTFKPDLIASSLGSDLDTLYKRNPSYQFQSLSAVNNNNEHGTTPTQLSVNNTKNNRLSFNGHALTQQAQQNTNVNTIEKTSAANANLSKSKSSLYSEPLDAITFRRFTNYRHS